MFDIFSRRKRKQSNEERDAKKKEEKKKEKERKRLEIETNLQKQAEPERKHKTPINLYTREVIEREAEEIMLPLIEGARKSISTMRTVTKHDIWQRMNESVTSPARICKLRF